MKRVGGILLLMLFGVSAKAQNLVPNPSFEEFIQCPWNHSMFDGYVSNWFRATQGTCDYFNVCYGSEEFFGVGVPFNFFGYQNPRTGSSYAGAYLYVPTGDREYVETELVAPLEADTSYYVEFFVSLCGVLHSTTTSNIHMLLSQQMILDTTTIYELNFAPQIINDSSNLISDTLGWTKISGYYIADGGEKFIVIGNFYDNDSTVFNDYGLSFPYHFSYYYIDDVSVMKCSQVGTSVQSVGQQVNVQLNPNPVSNDLQLTLNGFIGETQLEIVNVIGQRVFTKSFASTSKSFHQAVDISSLPSGLYFVSVFNSSQRVAKKIVKQ